MKKISKLKLNSISQEQLSNRQMYKIKAGGPGAPGDGGERTCYCSCAYEGDGGSGIHDNCRANYYIGPNGGHSVQVISKDPNANVYKCKATPS